MPDLSFIDDAFITLSRKQLGYDWSNPKKRQYKQRGEVFRIYYSSDLECFFGTLTTETSVTTLSGTFIEFINMANVVFSGLENVDLQFVYPTTWQEKKIIMLNEFISRDYNLHHLGRYMLLLL